MTVRDALAAALADRYRLERELGAGGMATVYLAEDLKHDRKVAIKVLKPELAAVLGAERFVQEIKTTAALTHPHILPLFDSGEAGGFLFYVMPYIEGETIRDKLNRETQFGVEDAVRIATEVADALDHAHRHGVIHRDIKPENILLYDGRAMVMDFGIALAVSAAAGGRMTETGLSLGTPHYMSPEQATADKEISARSDVYSLASVLYEMLAGEPPHSGGSAQQVIMKIVTEEAPPLSRRRKSVPPNVEAAVEKALQKLPADRFATAGEFRSALMDPGFAARAGRTGLGGMAVAGGRGAPAWTVHGLAALLVAALGFAAWGWLRTAEPPRVLRYDLDLAGPQGPNLDFGVPVAAPDDSYLIWIGPSDDGLGQQLWVKYREAADATPLPGSGNVTSFALSPDGEWVAFAGGGTIKKMPVHGGGTLPLLAGSVLASSGLAWLDDGRIVYVKGARGASELAAVSSLNGDTSTVWVSGQAALLIAPSPLPGGRGVLVTVCSSSADCDVWAVDLEADSAHTVVIGGQTAVVAPGGQILYASGGIGGLLAAPFDLDRLEVTGNPVALIDRLWDGQGYAAFSLSRGGTMVTVQGTGRFGRVFDMVWVDRAGRETPVDTAWTFRLTAIAGNYGWTLSPDGSRVAIGLNTDGGDDVWIKDLRTQALSRLTSDPGSDARPRWTPDGTKVIYVSDRRQAGAYERRADGIGPEILIRPGVINEVAWSPDGQWLLTREGVASAAAGGRDIQGYRNGDTVATPLADTQFDETAIALSPDGKWLAYASDEAGRSEIFLRPFPETSAGKFQVSTRGGQAPLWSRDGRELFFLSGDREMMSMRLSADPAQPVGPTVALFAVRPELLGPQSTYYTPWDVAADGRFLMARMTPITAGEENRIIVIEHFLEELKARVNP